MCIRDSVDILVGVWGGSSSSIKADSAGPHEAKLLSLDVSKADKLLGVRPVLDAAKAVAMTAEWYKLFYAKHPQMRAFSIKQIENFCSAARDKQIEWSF